MSPPDFEVALPRAVTAPGLARRQLESWFKAALTDKTLGDARLLVSELVTNAVLHGSGSIRLRAAMFADRVLVEVFDEGDGFAWTTDGERHIDKTAVNGWGLAIVEAEASRCGASYGPTRVWFEIDFDPPTRNTI